MKKLISLLLTICLILSLGAFSVSAEDAKLDKKDWKIEASSSFGDSAKYAIDGKIESYWHSFYEVVEGTAANKAGAPHELTITLPSETVISGFSYTPRTGGSTTGFVLKYELYAADETSGLKLIKSGEFEKKLEEQMVKFDSNIEAKTVVFRI
ncbi:MAG: discoidin domain-containing protein [Clostridia bacterium]|nr:discoidin domain-containing protein [Clostridia bacterium]